MGSQHNVLVLSFPNADDLGRSISQLLGLKHRVIQYKIFPDGESYVRLPEEVSGKHVILIQRTYPEPDKRIVEAVLATDALVSHKASLITLILPYLTYARQDKEFLKGEAVSVRAVLKLLSSMGVDNLVVIDVHKPESLKHFKGRYLNVIPVNTWVKCLSKINLVNPAVIAPDIGAAGRAEALSKALGCDYFIIRKARDRVTGEIKHELPERLSMNGRDVVVVDDIISTGGTIANIAKYLRSASAGRIYAVASHGLFVKDSLEKLRSSGLSKVFVLNTVLAREAEDLVEYCDVSKELADAIKESLLGDS